ncbi:hypothetical protein B0T22DRAFT_521450 [Podospora appendiculata]|uniref:Uncharacterized protein n=1 Tax=Podospora appendiculata TaxID=314037 RepID=A0AAE0X0N2_9PEZI|nr:hypothetical protein B0T22DRAFT_521450 [Podospora appendiculata]
MAGASGHAVESGSETSQAAPGHRNADFNSEHGDLDRPRKRHRASQGGNSALPMDFIDDDDDAYEDEPDEDDSEEVDAEGSDHQDAARADNMNMQTLPAAPHQLEANEEPIFLKPMRLFKKNFYPTGSPSHIDANEMAEHLGRTKPHTAITMSRVSYRLLFRAMKQMTAWMRPDRFANWAQARETNGRMPAVGSPSQIMAARVISLMVYNVKTSSYGVRFSSPKLNRLWMDSMLDFVLEEPRLRQVPAYWEGADFDSASWRDANMDPLPRQSPIRAGLGKLQNMDLNEYFRRKTLPVLATPADSLSPSLALPVVRPSSAIPTRASTSRLTVPAEKPANAWRSQTVRAQTTAGFCSASDDTNTSGRVPVDTIKNYIDNNLISLKAVIQGELDHRDRARAKERREARERAERHQALVTEHAVANSRMEQRIRTLEEKVAAARPSHMEDGDPAGHTSGSSYEATKSQSAKRLEHLFVPWQNTSSQPEASSSRQAPPGITPANLNRQPLVALAAAALHQHESRNPTRDPDSSTNCPTGATHRTLTAPRAPRSRLPSRDRATVSRYLSWVPPQDRELILELTNALPLDQWQLPDAEIAANLDSQYTFDEWEALVGDLRNVLFNLRYLDEGGRPTGAGPLFLVPSDLDF